MHTSGSACFSRDDYLLMIAHLFGLDASAENLRGVRSRPTASSRWVMRSFLSLAFFSPANAIFVPGMYFLGFSRYSNSVSLP